MRILDTKQFITDHTESRQDRRTDVFLQWMDKTPFFADEYFAIDRQLSTVDTGNGTIDSYFLEDSPIKRNVIKGLPLYGASPLTNETEYDDENGGFTTETSFEAIILPNVIMPSEGDVFTISGVKQKVLFLITEVREIALISRTHYSVTYVPLVYDKLIVVRNQVIDEYTAIFKNIGTESSVVMKDTTINEIEKIRAVYERLVLLYKSKFYTEKTSIISVYTNISLPDKPDLFIDKYLIKFMERNRIIIFDKILDHIFLLDNNGLDRSDDEEEYTMSLYTAFEECDKSLILEESFINVISLMSPLSLYKRTTTDWVYFSNKHCYDDANNTEYYKIDISFINKLFGEIVDGEDKITATYNMLNKLFSQYFNNETITIDSKSLKLLFRSGLSDLELYCIVPLILYVLAVEIEKMTYNIHNVLS